MGNATRFLQDNKEEEYDKVNFDFWSYKEESFNDTSYVNMSSLPVSSFGIEKVEVAMNLKSFQNQHDGDMANIIGALDQIT